jgi:hypothetical protein
MQPGAGFKGDGAGEMAIVNSPYYTNAMSEKKCATLGHGRNVPTPEERMLTMAIETHK